MDIKPKWRTSSVTGLCLAMRQENDYGALPILADAMEDAECDDTELLSRLRGGGLTPIESQKLVSLIMSDETAEAVHWMERFVRSINYSDYDSYDAETDKYINERQSDTNPHDYNYIIQQGMVGCGLMQNEWGGPKQMCFGTDDGADYFRSSESNVREFYRNWSLATGLAGPTNLNEVHFRCAC